MDLKDAVAKAKSEGLERAEAESFVRNAGVECSTNEFRQAFRESALKPKVQAKTKKK
jgi:nicotinate-nucleotide pyrophosphorylase